MARRNGKGPADAAASNSVGGLRTPLTDDILQQTIEAYLAAGLVVADTARALRIARPAVRRRLAVAVERGLIPQDKVQRPRNSRNRLFEDVVAARKDEFDRVDQDGTYMTERPIFLQDDGPFVIIALGDPHLDNPGTDLTLWEQWIAPMEDGPHWVRGVCLGDITDNWLKFLGHIYGSSEVTQQDGWTLIEGYLDKISDNLDVIVGGNHDLWNDERALAIMAQHLQVEYRAHGFTAAYTTPGGRKITLGMRHRFKGHSMYNAAHGVLRAATLGGWRCNMLIGGDLHISGRTWVKDPTTGFITHAHQLGSFKIYDSYAEKMGFRDMHVSPAEAFVIDPARDDTDPSLITPFADPEDAVAFCDLKRRAAGFE